MPSITFTDSVGAVTITAKAPRFLSWTPGYDVIGDVVESLGTGATFAFEFRHDHTCQFAVNEIPAADFAKMQRLKAHLIAGGQVTVNTDDLAARSYTAIRAPGTFPEWEWDPTLMRFTLRLAVKNTADAPMLCVYEP